MVLLSVFINRLTELPCYRKLPSMMHKTQRLFSDEHLSLKHYTEARRPSYWFPKELFVAVYFYRHLIIYRFILADRARNVSTLTKLERYGC